MLKPLLTLAAAAVLLASQIAGADEASIRKAFAAKFPKAEVQSVTKLPYLGLYEVVVEGEVLYADENFDYLIDGNIISTKTMSNLTEQKKRKLSAIPFAELPFEYAFKKVKGNGERKLAVFSDPDCPFCRQLEKSLNRLEDVTIYTMLYPIVELHPDARRKAELVWCASDRVQAWDALMLEGVVSAASGDLCTASVAEIARVARELFISGTPALVFEDGKLVPGALEVWQIEDRLARASEG